MRSIVHAIDKMNMFIMYIIGLLLMVVSVCVLAQVSVRFALPLVGLNVSAPWTEELARYLLIWIVFLGAGIGVRHSQMIALEFGIRMLSERLGVILRFGVITLSIAFFILLFWVGIQFVELGMTERSPAMELRKAWVYWAMPVGAALMTLNSLILVTDTILKGGDIRYAGDSDTLE